MICLLFPLVRLPLITTLVYKDGHLSPNSDNALIKLGNNDDPYSYVQMQRVIIMPSVVLLRGFHSGGGNVALVTRAFVELVKVTI